MIVVRKRDKIVLHSLIISFLLFFTFYITNSFLPVIGDQISDTITQKNIESLHLGMNEEDVLNILGKPFAKFYRKDGYTLSYSKKGIIDGTEIYIYIKNHKLDGIHMEFYDVSFYTCKYKYCSKILFCPKVTNRHHYDAAIPVN